MWFLYDNIAVCAVALVTCAFAWLYGGIVASALVPVIPWLWLLLLEVMIAFPQRHHGETTYHARSRVWRHMKNDPITWVALAFILLLQIPFVNTALCPSCDYPQIAMGARQAAPVPFLPYCVNRYHHLNVVLWFIPTLTCAIAVKHCLLKRGKRMLLEMIVWNGFLLAILGFVQQVLEAPAPLWGDFGEASAYFFSTFGYPNAGGDYFTTLFALSFGLWRWRFEDCIKRRNAHGGSNSAKQSGPGAFWAMHFYLVPTVVFFFAALTTLSRAAIILVTLLAIAFFVHTFVSLFKNMRKAKRVKACGICFLSLIIISLFAVIAMPKDLQNEIGTLDSQSVLERVTGKGQYHARVATELWKENLLFGCGGWGYKHLCIPLMTDKELAQIQKVGGVNVHNDYLQFLAEHGLVGFLCLASIIVMLVWPLGKIWRALVDSVRFIPPKEQPARPISIFVIPAPAFAILAAAFATLIHSFGDCVMRSPAVLSLLFIELAAMDGFLPKLREQKEE